MPNLALTREFIQLLWHRSRRPPDYPWNCHREGPHWPVIGIDVRNVRFPTELLKALNSILGVGFLWQAFAHDRSHLEAPNGRVG